MKVWNKKAANANAETVSETWALIIGAWNMVVPLWLKL
jgi:hypothetical protein